MASTAATLQILVTANTATANAGLARTNANLTKTAAGAKAAAASGARTSAAFRQLGAAARTAGVVGLGAGLVLGLKKAVEEAREADKAHRQTAAAIKSMGNQANVSVKHVEKMSQKLSLQSGIDDELIQSSQTLMLTFGNVRNEVGKNNKVFDQASQIALDLSARFDQDLSRASIMVGKALNDPILGLTNLSRIGVQFTEGQKKQIEGLVENGNLLKAQGLIMAELTRQTKGAAAAQADPFDKLGVAIDNVFEAMGKSLLPTFAKWANVVAKFIHQMSTGKKAGGDFAKVLRAIGDYAKFMIGIWKAVIAGLSRLINQLITFGKFGVKVFNWVVTAAKNTAKTVSKTWAKVMDGLKDVWNWVRTAWRDMGEFLVRPFEFAHQKIIDFLNLIIKAINLIPGVPDIGLISSGGGGTSSQKTQAKRRGGGRQAGGLASIVPGVGSGDKVHMQAMVEPGEGIFVMNRNAMSALQAANDAVPRFQMGGQIPHLIDGGDVGDFLGNTPIAKGITGVGDIIGKLPGVGDLPDWIQGTGTYVLNAAKDYIKDKASGIFGGGAAMNIAGVKGAGIIAVGRMLQAAGYQVGEHPAFGGVSGVHVSGSAHYSGRAIDVNHGGNEMAALDRAAKILMKINHSQIIWRNHDLDTGAPIGGHMDHLHFAMQRGGIVRDFARAGVDTKASKKAMFALFMAGMAESGMRDLGYGHSSSEGVLQLLNTTASGYGISPHNEYDVAKGFLTHGYWGRGGANALAGRVGSAAMIAHLVQGNATGTGVYSAQAGAARSLLRGAGLRFPNNRAMWDKGGAGKGKTKQTKAPKAPAGLPIPAKLQNKITSLTALVDQYAEFADRAGGFGGSVGGMDELGWLTKQLETLLILRNRLVTAYLIILGKVEAMNEAIAKSKPGKARKALKEKRTALSGHLGTVAGTLGEIQGTPAGINPYGLLGSMPALGVLGGSLGEIQLRIHDMGEDTSSVSDRTNLSAGQLKELGYLSSLGVNFNPSQFAGFFAGGGVLGAGQWGIAGERGPEAVVGPAAISPAGGAVNVRVFIGDRELTDIVRVETDSRERGARGAYMAGRGAR